VWESALHKRLIRPDQLTSTAWRGPRANELARVAGILSDSGLETLFAHRLRRIGVQMRQQVWIGDRPVDGLIGARLVVQIDGFEHHKKVEQRRADIAHDRMLRLAGYTVLRYDYHQVTAEWPRVEAEILAAIAQRLHLSRPA
jgi:very-short-patch-repair endonuclease